MRSSLLILSIIFCLGTQAQIKKGSILLGGNLGFSYSKNQASLFSISTQYAKAYKDNKFCGFLASYGHTSQINITQNYYAAGVFYRRYVSIVKELYFFGEADFSLGFSRIAGGNSIPPSAYTQSDQYTALASLMPGLSYAVNRKLHLEIAFNNLASLFYNHQIDKHISGSSTFINKSNNIGLYTSTQLNFLGNIRFGFRFLFDK